MQKLFHDNVLASGIMEGLQIVVLSGSETQVSYALYTNDMVRNLVLKHLSHALYINDMDH